MSDGIFDEFRGMGYVDSKRKEQGGRVPNLQEMLNAIPPGYVFEMIDFGPDVGLEVIHYQGNE